MRRLLACLTAVLLATATAASAESDMTARGRLLVQRHCASCHAVTRQGDSPNPAAPRFRELNQRYHIDELGEALAEGILTGHPAMPQFAFSPKDVKAILAYLRSIQTEQQASRRHEPIG